MMGAIGPLDQKAARDWLIQEFERTGKNKKGLAMLWGQSESAVSRVLSAQRKIQLHEWQIAQAYFEDTSGARAVDEPTTGIVQEIDGYGGMGAGGITMEDFAPDGMGGQKTVDAVRETWRIPPAFMRNVLDVGQGQAYIIRAVGDSMSPVINHNDRVMIDVHHRRPSPPGIFAVWDGDGADIALFAISANIA